MDDKINIFFFDLFLELRKLGIELDLNQFQDFIQLLSTSEHISKGMSATEKKKALLLLCKTLWLTKVDHKDKFEELFEKAFARAAKEGGFFVDKSSVNKNKKEKDEAEAKAKAAREAKAKAEIEAKKKELDSKFNEAEGSIDVESSDGEDEQPLIEKVADKTNEGEECNVFLNFREGAGDATIVEEIKEQSKKKSVFVFSDEKHLPFSTRKGKQI